MKIAEGYIIRNIVGDWVAVPVGKASSKRELMISLTDSSALLWKLLEKGAEENELVDALLDKFDIDSDKAQADVKAFLLELEAENLLIK